MLIPSHGVVMKDPPAAVEQMKRNFDAVMDNYLITVGWPDFRKSQDGPRVKSDGVLAGLYPDKKPARLPPLPQASYPAWIREVAITTQAIVADNRE